MAVSKAEELARRVQAEGFKYEYDGQGAWVATGAAGERVRIERGGDILFKKGSEALAELVGRLRDEVVRDYGAAQMADDNARSDERGFDTIKIAAHIFREYDAGRLNDYAAQYLLNHLPEVASAFGRTGDYAAACRTVMEENDMRHDYQGYGSYMVAISKAEAANLFVAGAAVYDIHEGDVEGRIDDDCQFDKYDSFYAVEANGGNPYLAKADTADELLDREAARRLAAIGYEYRQPLDGAPLICRDGREIASIHGNELVFSYARASDGVDITAIYNTLREINEYVPAYLLARSKDAVLVAGYYALQDSNGYVLGAKERDDGKFQFVTWKKDRDGTGYDHGHYSDDYTNAKEDFAVRAGLVRNERMLTETELTVVRSSLSDYLELDARDYIEPAKEDVIKGVIEKIDSVIEPEIEYQARDEEQGDDEEEVGLEE